MRILAPKMVTVSTHSRPKAAAALSGCNLRNSLFQLTAARRRLHQTPPLCDGTVCVSTHSRPKAAALATSEKVFDCAVSTHSRPKAAADVRRRTLRGSACFNSQPPEGGCLFAGVYPSNSTGFQLTAARRRLPTNWTSWQTNAWFQLTAARRRLHFHPFRLRLGAGFQLTAARRRLRNISLKPTPIQTFQLTAARRRLLVQRANRCEQLRVSTHSRPKAAACTIYAIIMTIIVSTHSRPKAAAASVPSCFRQTAGFNSQPPEGG